MQTLLEFLPVIAFVAAYWLADLKTAIGVIMVAAIIQLGLMWLLTRKVPRMALMSALLVIGLGGISLILNNDLVFKWKPTVLNWLFAAAFLGSNYIGKKPLAQRMLQSVAGSEITLSDNDWHVLNSFWVVYFLTAGAANIIVAYSFSEAFWVNFKLFGLLGLTIIFLVAQAIWLARRDESLPDATNTRDQ